MRRATLTLVGLFLLATASQAQDKAQALLDKAIQARGGADKLNKLKAWQSKTKGTIDIPMLGFTEFTGESEVQQPDNVRITLNLQIMGQEVPFALCYNGKEAWREGMGQVIDLTGPALKARRAAVYVDRLTLLTPLKDKQYTLTALDEIKVGDKPAVGIKIAAKDQSDVKFYFDSQSHLLVKIDGETLDPMTGAAVPTSTTMSNHKAFDGIQFPTKLLVERDGKRVQEMEVLEVKIVDKIDPKKFEKPVENLTPKRKRGIALDCASGSNRAQSTPLSAAVTGVTQADPDHPGRPWRRWVGLTALLILLAVGGVGYYHYRSAGNQLEAAIARAAASDPHWQFEDILARRLEVPDDENAALVVLKIKDLLPKNFLTEEKVTDLLSLPPETLLTDEQGTLLRTELAGLGAAVAQARKLVAMPRGRYPLTVRPDVLSTVLHSQHARTVANLLFLDAMERGQQGDAEGAVASSRACLNASRSIGDEPFAISMLIRLAVRASALQALERALAQGEPSAASLREYQLALEEDERNNPLATCIQGERAGMDQLVREIAAGRTNPRVILGRGPTGNAMVDDFYFRSVSAPTLTRAVLLEYYTDMLEIAGRPPHERAALLKQKTPDATQLPRLAKSLMPSMDRIMEVDVRQRALVRTAIVGLALERYRIDHGQYPEQLEAIIPKYLATTPLDPYDGKPLRYKRLADGAVVYSISQDGTDDGGAMDRKNQRTPNTDYGFRLWDVKARRQAPRPLE